LSAKTKTPDAGYSLVELLVVFLLLSFIAIAVSGGFRFGTRVWETTDARVVEARRLATTQLVLRTLLASAIPKMRGEFIVFDGQPRHISFEAPAPRALGVGGLSHIDLDIAQTKTGSDIHVAVRAPAAGGAKREAVFSTIAQTLSVAYLDTYDGRPIWLDRWRDRNRLPSAIRISDPQGADHWPAFIVRLSIDEPPTCAFDPVTLDCRRS